MTNFQVGQADSSGGGNGGGGGGDLSTVPEAGTMVLLGSALVSLRALGRKLPKVLV